MYRSDNDLIPTRTAIGTILVGPSSRCASGRSVPTSVSLLRAVKKKIKEEGAPLQKCVLSLSSVLGTVRLDGREMSPVARSFGLFCRRPADGGAHTHKERERERETQGW